MKRLRDVFPNACQLTYERNERAPEAKSIASHVSKIADPTEVIGDFLEQVRCERMTKSEVKIINSALHDLCSEGNAA
jgi:exonuclease SbcD